MITTKSIGEETANPKPVRHINWCGQPMKEGDNYWGESKPQPQPPPPPQVQSVTRPRRKRGGRSAWTAERRAAFGAKIKAMWQAKQQLTKET